MSFFVSLNLCCALSLKNVRKYNRGVRVTVRATRDNHSNRVELCHDTKRSASFQNWFDEQTFAWRCTFRRSLPTSVGLYGSKDPGILFRAPVTQRDSLEIEHPNTLRSKDTGKYLSKISTLSKKKKNVVKRISLY
jgi:hypothetical protein